MTAAPRGRFVIVPVVALLIAMFGCAVIVAMALAHIAKAYVPFDRAHFAPLLFVHYRLPLARLGLREIAGALVVWTAIFFATLRALRRGSHDKRAIVAIFAAQAVLLAIVLASPLPLDSDQYGYIGYGAAVESHANPYQATPLPPGASIVRERVAAHWGNPQVRDPYGPLWTLANGAVLWPFRTLSLDVQARVLRFLAALAALVSSLLIAGIVNDPRWRATSVAAFALNPLVILETANGAHNDILMVACALGAVYLLRRNALAPAGILLGCAIAMKFAYAPLVIPFVAYAYVRTRKLTGVFIALACVAAPVALAAAFFGLYDSLVRPLLSHRGDVLNNLPLFDRLNLQATKVAVAAAMSGCALLAAAQVLRRNLAVVAWPLTAVLLLTWLSAEKIEPWYALMLTPLVLFAGYGGVAIFVGISTASLVMLAGSFLNVFPTTLTLVIALLLVLGARYYAVAVKSGTSLTTTLRPSSLPS